MIRPPLLFLAILLLGGAGLAATAEAPTVAVVVAVRGQGQVLTADKSRPLKVMARLQADDRIVLSQQDSTADIVLYSTREHLRLNGQSKVRILAENAVAEAGPAPVKVKVYAAAAVPLGSGGRRIAGSVSRPADKLTSPMPKSAVRPRG